MFVLADYGVVSPSTDILEKTNMLLLTKKAIEKDRSLTTQFLLSSSNYQSSERISEAVWKKNVFGFFSDEKANFNISIKIFLKIPCVI